MSLFSGRIAMELRAALVLCGLVLPLWASAQPVAPIVLGQRLQMRSQSLGEMRSYQVHRPGGYDISNARYPVVIVLDGEDLFQHLSTTVDLLSAAGKIPPLLVVGIPNVDRQRDLDSTLAPGSSAFLKFITDELVPKIDRDYRTRPYRILMGHSNGGLFTLYSMISAPAVFRGYVAMAAAFGDAPELPKTIAAFLDSHREPVLNNADLFMVTDDSTGMPLSGAWELSSHLQDRAVRVRDLRFTLQRSGQSHSAVPLRSMQDGLTSIFDGWELQDPFTLYEQGGLTAIDKHFAALSERLGFDVPVPAETLFKTFTTLEGRKRFPEAEQVIKRAIESFPGSSSAFYYAARLYAQMGNRDLALESSKKALLISANDPGTRYLLREYLKVDPNTLVPEAHVNSNDLARFAGSYGASAAVFQVEQRGDKLVGKTSDSEYDLDPLSATTFRYSGESSYDGYGVVSFRSNDRGRITGLEFDNGGAALAKLK
jgi:tetratricopeptide (TPR) repeat protein